MPGRSLTRPPRISTTECSWRLCPSPGMYVVTSIPFVSRTRATLRRAEFGFFGVFVYTRVHTPRFCGAPRRAGVLVLVFGLTRPLRTSWLTVGIYFLREVPDRTKAGGGVAPANRPRHGSKALASVNGPERVRNPHRKGNSRVVAHSQIPTRRLQWALR